MGGALSATRSPHPAMRSRAGHMSLAAALFAHIVVAGFPAKPSAVCTAPWPQLPSASWEISVGSTANGCAASAQACACESKTLCHVTIVEFPGLRNLATQILSSGRCSTLRTSCACRPPWARASSRSATRWPAIASTATSTTGARFAEIPGAVLGHPALIIRGKS